MPWENFNPFSNSSFCCQLVNLTNTLDILQQRNLVTLSCGFEQTIHDFSKWNCFTICKNVSGSHDESTRNRTGTWNSLMRFVERAIYRMEGQNSLPIDDHNQKLFQRMILHCKVYNFLFSASLCSSWNSLGDSRSRSAFERSLFA